MRFRSRSILRPILAILLGLLCGALFIAAAGANPVPAYFSLFRAGFGCSSLDGFCAILTALQYATPLVLSGLSAMVAFRAGFFSIGQAGQMMFGAGMATFAAGAIPLDGFPLPALALLAGLIGGAAANTAVWLAGLGVRVGLSGNDIGLDAYGADLWKRLSAHPNLDLEHVTRDPAATTPFCRVMVTPDGERTFLVYGYPQSPKTTLVEAMLRGARFLALDLYGGEERLAAARLGHAAGVTTAIGDVIDPDHPILPFTGIATNSAAYIRAAEPGADVPELARRLREISGGIVITTDGGNPVHAIDRDGAEFTVRPPEVTPVDATGAGDAFRAGLLAGLVRGLDLKTSVRWGAAAGALKVQRVGAATEVPGLEEVVEVASTLSGEKT